MNRKIQDPRSTIQGLFGALDPESCILDLELLLLDSNFYGTLITRTMFICYDYLNNRETQIVRRVINRFIALTCYITTLWTLCHTKFILKITNLRIGRINNDMRLRHPDDWIWSSNYRTDYRRIVVQ